MEYRFRIIDKTLVYQGFFKLSEYRLQHELFAGGWTPEFRRLCLDRGDAVAVLLWDPQRDVLVLAEQFRVGAMHRPFVPWLLEIVAGMIEPGESREEVAQREAMEEAGCEILALEFIVEYLCSPGGTSESTALYLGRVDAANVGGIHGLAEEHEDIRVHVIPRLEALQMIGSRLNSAAPIIALQWLELNRERLLRQWELA